MLKQKKEDLYIIQTEAKTKIIQGRKYFHSVFRIETFLC